MNLSTRGKTVMSVAVVGLTFLALTAGPVMAQTNSNQMGCSCCKSMMGGQNR